MARSVTLKELHDWLNKPEVKKYTWFMGDEGAFNHNNDGLPVVKYLDFCFDTRTYDVWSITIRSFIPETTVRDDDSDPRETILDVLEDKIKEYLEKTNG